MRRPRQGPQTRACFRAASETDTRCALRACECAGATQGLASACGVLGGGGAVCDGVRSEQNDSDGEQRANVRCVRGLRGGDEDFLGNCA